MTALVDSGSLSHLVLAGELQVGDVGRQVGVENSTEGQPVIPATAEVGDVDVLQRRSITVRDQQNPSHRLSLCLTMSSQTTATTVDYASCGLSREVEEGTCFSTLVTLHTALHSSERV